MKYTKGITLGTALALLLSGATAQAAGPYAGFSLGYQDIDIDYHYESLSIESAGGSGASFRAVVGYDSFNLAPPYLLGIEANFGQGGAEAKVSIGDLQIKGSAEESYGLAVRFGRYFGQEEVAAYGLLGYQRTNFEASVGSYSADADFDGLRVGGGVDFRVAPQVDLRLQYSRTYYESRTFEGEKFEPEESLFEAGVMFRF